VSGSGISWAICKSAPCPRQITTRPPNQQRQSTEGNMHISLLYIVALKKMFCPVSDFCRAAARLDLQYSKTVKAITDTKFSSKSIVMLTVLGIYTGRGAADAICIHFGSGWEKSTLRGRFPSDAHDAASRFDILKLECQCDHPSVNMLTLGH